MRQFIDALNQKTLKVETMLLSHLQWVIRFK